MMRRLLTVASLLSALVILLAAPAGAQTTTLAPTTPTTAAPAAGAATPPAPATATTTAAPLFGETTQTNQRTAATPTGSGEFGQPPSTVDPGVLVFQNPIAPIDDSNKVSITVGDNAKPSQSVLIILLLTLLSLAPSILILLTSFTRIAIVLSLVRNAIGLQSIPPNQVIVGLAVFLSLFVMRPTFEQMNKEALQPLLKNEITQAQAYSKALTPLRAFMLKQTGSRELKMMMAVSKEKKPATPKDVSNATLIPAFILSELRIAFIIGFVIFIPFLVIDLVVSSSLMSMGMMMLPPVVISLPFKLLLFVLVDGWSVIVKSLIESFL